MRVDLHQHIWTTPLLEALQARRSLPFVRIEHGVAVLHCAGERPSVIDVAAEEPARRAGLLLDDGLDLAVIAPSSPIGIEALERSASKALIDAHLAGIEALGAGFRAWGPVALDAPEPDDVDRVLMRGCVGISMPAGALAGRAAMARIGAVLERIAALDVPVLIHPGPAPGERHGEAEASDPGWWPALTDYVSQMQAAWLTFTTFGRREHPRLVVVFAMLAGGAPLLSERLAARGGPAIDLRDPRVFYDTSSYGPGATAAMAAQVGLGQLVYGSDRPVIEPVHTGREAALKASSAAVLRLGGSKSSGVDRAVTA